MKYRIENKGLKFVLEIFPNLPENIIVDAAKLRQVLINLIGNALKYTKNGEIILRVKLEKYISREIAWVLFQVEDSGIGIDQNELDLIFESFKQASNQPVNESGTGLGLAISKQFVEIMGGQIGVSSTVGKGSIFQFNLPVKVDLSKKHIIKGQSGKQVTGLIKGQKPYRLLIAEDNTENRLLLVKLLEPLGFQLMEALNGEQALSIFQNWKPHLIWMDIRMPGMSGLEATRLIKKSEEGNMTKVIALTAHALEEERQEILAAGFDDLIRKPYYDADIFNALEKHLGINFTYGGNQFQTSDNSDKNLDIKQLGKIPFKLVQQFQEALILLDDNECFKVVKQINEFDPELSQSLNYKLEEFQYKEILKVMDAIVMEKAHE